MTTSDMPMDVSFTPSEEPKPKKTPKAKINTIGKTAENKVVKNPKKSKEVDSALDNDLRSKLGNSSVDIDDLDKLNEENIKNYRFKAKRNKVVIVVLSILLILSIAGIATYLAISKLQTNCNLYVSGVDATFYVNGDEMSKFRAPSNVQGNSILNLNLTLKIKDGGRYNVIFYPKCYQKNVLMENTLIYDHETDLFEYDEENDVYRSIEPISGNQTITLCGGVILDRQYEHTLTVDNFRLDFYVEFDKV